MTTVFCTAKTCNYNKYHDEDYGICQRTKIILDENVDSIFEGCPDYKDKSKTEPQIKCPKCGRSDYIRSFEDWGIDGGIYKYKCINCNTYIKDKPQTDCAWEKKQTMKRHTKEYALKNGRAIVFEYDDNGVGRITLECMDKLMDIINKAENFISEKEWRT